MDVRFYRTEAGNEPVKEYLRPLEQKQRDMVGAVIRRIQDKSEIPPSAKSVKGWSPLCEL